MLLLALKGRNQILDKSDEKYLITDGCCLVEKVILYFLMIKTGKISKPLPIQTLADHFLFLNPNLKDINVKKNAIVPCAGHNLDWLFCSYKCISVQYKFNSGKVGLHLAYTRKFYFLWFVSRCY